MTAAIICCIADDVPQKLFLTTTTTKDFETPT
jgi:hypothetical protein